MKAIVVSNEYVKTAKHIKTVFSMYSHNLFLNKYGTEDYYATSLKLKVPSEITKNVTEILNMLLDRENLLGIPISYHFPNKAKQTKSEQENFLIENTEIILKHLSAAKIPFILTVSSSEVLDSTPIIFYYSEELEEVHALLEGSKKLPSTLHVDILQDLLVYKKLDYKIVHDLFTPEEREPMKKYLLLQELLSA